MLNKIETANAPAAIGPYSQAMEVNGFIFTSGQIPLSPATGEVVGEDMRAQCEQVMQNLKGVLEAAGSGFGQVAKTLCFIADMKDFPAFNEVYSKYFIGNPARSCVAVKDLPKGVLVEVEAVAVRK